MVFAVDETSDTNETESIEEKLTESAEPIENQLGEMELEESEQPEDPIDIQQENDIQNSETQYEIDEYQTSQEIDSITEVKIWRLYNPNAGDHHYTCI